MPLVTSLLDFIRSSRKLLQPLPAPISTTERLRKFPHQGVPLKKSATIYWNANQIPFIDAQTDDDAALLLGMVHAHLRLGQLELYRRVVSGRLSEIAGPATLSMDWTIRLLGIDRAVPEVEKKLPDDTRAWLTRFAEGINFYRSRVKREPPEVTTLGLKQEPWTVTELLRVSRLAAADVSWFTFLSYFTLRGKKGFAEFWERYCQVKASSATGAGLYGDASRLSTLLGAVSHGGSNSFVLSPKLSRSGAAVIANDPHLGVSLPNIWLIAGYRCPSYHVTGFMLPGAPFVALGRNPHIAWGGTNLHAQSSDFYDASHIKDNDPSIRTETQTIRVRFWRDKQITIRHTPLGTLLSDSPLFAPLKTGEKIAFRWVGHDGADEITAMLRMNRARSVQEYADSFSGYSVSAQNFLVADSAGHIGHVVAAKVPRRGAEPGRPFVLNPGHSSEWKRFWVPKDFPLRMDPPEGFIASANNRLPENFPSVGTQFPPTDRVDRISELIRGKKSWDALSLVDIQRDTYSRSSVRLRDLFLEHLEPMAKDSWRGWMQELANWDGHYHRQSRAPVVLQSLLFNYIRYAYGSRYGVKIQNFILGSEMSRLMAMLDMDEGQPFVREALERAAERTTSESKRFGRWGDIHRLRLAHLLQAIPAIGKKFRFFDLPAEGSTETIQKTAHSVTSRRHTVHYGAQARHISDLADLDHNYFSLLGGQDGWWGSQNFSDQVVLWEKGKLIQVPLRIETVRKLFKGRIDLEAA